MRDGFFASVRRAFRGAIFEEQPVDLRVFVGVRGKSVRIRLGENVAMMTLEPDEVAKDARHA
jgi:hypothetical protein